MLCISKKIINITLLEAPLKISLFLLVCSDISVYVDDLCHTFTLSLYNSSSGGSVATCLLAVFVSLAALLTVHETMLSIAALKIKMNNLKSFSFYFKKP